MKNEIKQQLISGNSRNGDWKRCLFTDKFERITRKNKDGNRNVLTISAQQGLINQFEYYNHQYASEDTSSYTLLKRGDFAYNKSYSDGYPWGALKRLERYDSGIVSPLYICFAPKNGVCSDFYKQYFEAGLFNREIYKIAQEGARNHGLLNVSTEDFFNAMLADPPIEEQRKIAEILGCCDEVIRLKKELIAEKKKQKKALMQKLLDPNSGFRLPGFSKEWNIVTINDVVLSKGQYGINAPAINYSLGLPRYIRITDIDDSGKFIAKNDAYVNIVNSSEYRLSTNDILFVRTGATVGKTYLYNELDGELVFAGFLIRFHLDPEKMDRFFMKNIVSTKQYWDWVQTMSARSGQPGINAEEIGQYKFLCPERKEQQAIAKILLVADQGIDLLEQELTEQEKKKKSLMQLLLTGIVSTN